MWLCRVQETTRVYSYATSTGEHSSRLLADGVGSQCTDSSSSLPTHPRHRGMSNLSLWEHLVQSHKLLTK